MDIRPFLRSHAPAVDRLLDRCFGPARAQRTADLVRAGAPRIDSACLVLLDGGALLGAVQTHGVVWQAPARSVPLAWLGPLLVSPDARGRGIGQALMAAALAALDDAPVALIGDAPYYGRWGFSAATTGRWWLPGPVDRARLLLRAPRPALFDRPALLGAAPALSRAA